MSKELEKRDRELAAARESLGLTTQPVRTLLLFCHASADFLLDTTKSATTSKPLLFLGLPLSTLWLCTQWSHPHLYAAPGCGGRGPAPGPLYTAQLWAYEALWWLVLGILSSIGFGSGLHSGIMFLWPFVMRVILKAEANQTTRFSTIYNHPCGLYLWGENGDGTNTFLNQLILVWPAALLWGAGTAIGELPPYFITRAARRAGKADEAFETELADARANSDLVSRLKVWTIDFTERTGFLGIFFLASWPNAAFDMCGMACGWLDMPFWTFFGATLVGKSLAKTTIQSSVCIAVFGNKLFAAVTGALKHIPGAGDFLAEKATTLREKVMRKFSMQRRFTAEDLLDGSESLNAKQLAMKYCDCPGRGCSCLDEAGRASASEAGARAVAFWDASADASLNFKELTQAQSGTDGMLSLASLDPGTDSFISPGGIWNLFLALLILYFVRTTIEHVAFAMQAELDERELKALKQKASKSKRA